MFLHELRLQGFFTPDEYDFKCAVCDGVFVGQPDHCMLFAENPVLSDEFKRDQLTGQSNHLVVNNIFFCEPCVRRSRREPVDVGKEKLLEINQGPDSWTIHYSL